MWILRKSFPQYEFPWMFFPSFKRWIRQSWRSHQDFLWHAKERRKVGEEGPVYLCISPCLKIDKNVSFESCNFGIFHQFSKIRQNLAFFGTFNENVNLARFARNVEWDFFCDFQTPWTFLFCISETDFPISKPRMKGGKTRWGTICRWTRISAREIKPNMAQDTSGSWRTSKRQTSRWWLQLHQYRKFQRYISTFFMIFYPCYKSNIFFMIFFRFSLEKCFFILFPLFLTVFENHPKFLI